MLRDIFTITKKGLKDCFSDKVILAQILILPFVMVFGYSLLMATMSKEEADVKEKDYTAYYINAPEYMKEGLGELGIEPTEQAVQDIKKQISCKECDLLVTFPRDFVISEVGGTELSDVQIWYNSERTDSVMLYNSIMNYMSSFQPKLFSVNINSNIDYDLGDENYAVKKLLGILLPLIILMSVFMLCMNLAAESIAGDKERGFLNTMLIAPVKRSSIATGKALCIFIVAVIGGISAFIGMAVSLPTLADSAGATEKIYYRFSEYLLLFGVTITAVFVLAGILLILSTVAKDIRQATSIAPIFMSVLMVASMLTIVESIGEIVDRMGMINGCIPAWNTMVIMQDIIACDYALDFVVVTCMVNLVFSAIAVFVVGRLFKNEKIVTEQ